MYEYTIQYNTIQYNTIQYKYFKFDYPCRPYSRTTVSGYRLMFAIAQSRFAVFPSKKSAICGLSQNSRTYNTIQYNTIQYSTVQYNTTQQNTIQYNTTRYLVRCHLC